MKVFILLAALAAVASAATLNSAASERFSQEFRAQLYNFLGGRADIIPPFNETQQINDTRVEFNNELLVGWVELIGATAHGLHTLVDDIDFNLITLKASGTVTVETVQIVGAYGADLVIHLPFIEPPFTNETIAAGVGAGDLGAGGVTITFSANIIPNFITDRVVITHLDADVQLGSLHLYLEGLVVDGELVDWELVNQDALGWFNHLVDTQRDTLLSALQEIINTILKEIKLSDIIGAIGK